MREIFVVGYEHYEFAKSLIVGEIEFLDHQIDLEAFDCFIFTSKNAIKALAFLAEKYPKMQRWKTIPSFVIGKGSAETLHSLGGNLAFIPSDFHSDIFIQEMLQELGKHPLYLRAKEIASSLDTLLQAQGIQLVSKIVYQSKFHLLDSSLKPPKDSMLLFTSPSAYRFFLKNFGWDQSYLAVALGKTTFASFDLGIQKILSPVQGIQKSIESLQKHF